MKDIPVVHVLAGSIDKPEIMSSNLADRELQAARKGGSAVGKKLVGGHHTNRSMSIA